MKRRSSATGALKGGLEALKGDEKEDGEAFIGDENELNAGGEALKANEESFKDDEDVLKCDMVR